MGGLDLATICWPDCPTDQIVAAPGTESISPEKVCGAGVQRARREGPHAPGGELGEAGIQASVPTWPSWCPDTGKPSPQIYPLGFLSKRPRNSRRMGLSLWVPLPWTLSAQRQGQQGAFLCGAVVLPLNSDSIRKGWALKPHLNLSPYGPALPQTHLISVSLEGMGEGRQVPCRRVLLGS